MSYFIKLKTHLIIGLKMWSCQYFYIFFSNHWQKRRLWMKYITFIIFNKTSSWYLLFFFLNNTFPQHSISTISSCIHKFTNYWNQYLIIKHLIAHYIELYSHTLSFESSCFTTLIAHYIELDSPVQRQTAFQLAKLLIAHYIELYSLF